MCNCLLCFLCALMTVTAVRRFQDGRAEETTTNACAQQSLYLAARLAGHPVSLEHVADMLPFDGRERTLEEVGESASNLGLQALWVQWPLDAQPTISSPCIAYVKSAHGHTTVGHYAVLLPCSTDTYVLINHPRAPVVITANDLQSFWTGKILHVARDTKSLQPVVTHRRRRKIAKAYLVALLSLFVIGAGLYFGRRLRPQRVFAKKESIGS